MWREGAQDEDTWHSEGIQKLDAGDEGVSECQNLHAHEHGLRNDIFCSSDCYKVTTVRLFVCIRTDLSRGKLSSGAQGNVIVHFMSRISYHPEQQLLKECRHSICVRACNN